MNDLCKPDYRAGNWPALHVTTCEGVRALPNREESEYLFMVARQATKHEPTDAEGLKAWPFCLSQPVH